MGLKWFGLMGKPAKDETWAIPTPPGPDKPATRYRSFVERYLIESIRLWPAKRDPRELAHITIQDATSIYNMIRRADETYGKE